MAWYGEGDLPFLLTAAVINVAATLAIVLTLGKWLARRSKVLAAVICGASVPLLIIVFAVILLLTAPKGPPPDDAPAMLFVAMFMVAVMSTPISFLTSAAGVALRYRDR